MATICDFPGCDEPATTITHAEGRNTPPKEWRACVQHEASVQHRDDCGNVIRAGDLVKVTALHAGRGAFLGITQGLGEVVGFARTRVVLQFTYRVGVDRVGAEYLRIVEPVDGRPLRTPGDAWAERV